MLYVNSTTIHNISVEMVINSNKPCHISITVTLHVLALLFHMQPVVLSVLSSNMPNKKLIWCHIHQLSPRCLSKISNGLPIITWKKSMRFKN